MRRLAIFSDVHGNQTALEAVLADIAAARIEESYCLGDLVGYGPDPAGVVDRIRHEGIPTIRGNYDEGVGTGRGDCGCYYKTEQAKESGAASYAFTVAALTDDQLGWLASLPHELRIDDSGVSLLLTHGSPRKINEYLLPDREDRQLIRLAEQAHADVVCVGHVHVLYHRSMRTVEGKTVHYVSAGSVGKPKDGDRRAGWVELVLGSREEVHARSAGDAASGPIGSSDTWLGTIAHRVDYDVDAVARDMISAGLPEELASALRVAG